MSFFDALTGGASPAPTSASGSYYPKYQSFSLDFEGKKYTFEFGKIATLANCSCVATCGGTTVLATVVMSADARDIDFMPLMVNYNEKLYAAGMIKSSRFMKREGRPSDDITLVGRLIDRSLRPLFPKYLRNDVQVMLTTLSYDRENEHDILSSLAASVALHASDIPWAGPIATVRVGLIDGKLVANPTKTQRETSDLDLVVSSTAENVLMIEAGANEVPEDKMLEAIEFGKAKGQEFCKLFSEIQAKIGKTKKEMVAPEKDKELIEWITKTYETEFVKCLWEIPGKKERMLRKKEIYALAKAQALENFEEERITKNFSSSADAVWKTILRDAILNHEKRIAERKLDQIRPINVEVGLFERTHGSALFQRGETQGLSITTLASPAMAQTKESIGGETKSYYMHHYNFPPFSVGEASNRLMTGNREIGHGALAERALIPVLPNREGFPYTIRVVTEILMSNGSSSMASVCGSTLSLMDAGVPITAPVAGIAMGLITEDGTMNGKYKILSDIQDDEDFVGDMDFKVAGTAKGITAIQMDIKVSGLSKQVFEQALTQAKKGRLEILDKMLAVLTSPRTEMSQYAPRLTSLQIDPERIGKVIGKGGETIQKIIAETGCEIDISDDGMIVISCIGGDGAERAVAIIKGLVEEAEVGKSYDTVIKRVEDYGAFAEILPGIQGLIHVSMISGERINSAADVLQVGQKVRTKLIGIDDKGRLKLSIKDAE
ncbi:MAG: polyribonucleotide nucleotidyltransferase [Candidatus Peregrinibacteria bacterium]